LPARSPSRSFAAERANFHSFAKALRPLLAHPEPQRSRTTMAVMREQEARDQQNDMGEVGLKQKSALRSASPHFSPARSGGGMAADISELVLQL
jgi:hypothetical protein